MRVAYFILPITLFISCAMAIAGGSAVLVIRNAPDDLFADEASHGTVDKDADTYTVIGLLNPPTLSVPEASGVALYDADSSPVPFRFEESSVYREFDDINSMRIAFEVDKKTLARGPVKVKWGEGVSIENSPVEKIIVDPEQKERYKTFVVEERPESADKGSRVATLEVVVEDSADIYYLWYLLPMLVVFVMLAARKYIISKSEQTPGE